MASKTRGRVRVEDSPKRVRVLFGGRWIADTTRAKLVWEKPYYPTYYFPAEDVESGLLTSKGEERRSPSRGTAQVHTVEVGDRTAPDSVLWYRTSELDGIADHLTFDWDVMDAWFEEDEQVHVHARDPYTRIDVLQSSRHVQVEVDGVVVADSHQPRMLFETGLPTRFYLPKTDVRMDLLRPSDTRTHCPYKGTAHYYDLVLDESGEGSTREDLVWWYPAPLLESVAIAGYVCFYDEKVDIRIDGVLQDRPKSPFS